MSNNKESHIFCGSFVIVMKFKKRINICGHKRLAFDVLSVERD